MDLSLEVGFHGTDSFHSKKFQSLFSWISLWKAGRPNDRRSPVEVSILVFMDLSLEGVIAGQISDDSDPVSILVFMDLSLEEARILAWAFRYIVSILVFMDLSLEGGGPIASAKIKKCFNPCFHGSLSGRQGFSRTQASYSSFQSLFSWISLWKTFDRVPIPPMFTGFNPCFHGSLSGRHGLPSHTQRRNDVSILVFMDLSLEVHRSWALVPRGMLFQSLFSWISLWKGDGARLKILGDGVSILVFMDLSLEAIGLMMSPWV